MAEDIPELRLIWKDVIPNGTAELTVSKDGKHAWLNAGGICVARISIAFTNVVTVECINGELPQELKQ